jgi:superoxide dismutase
MGTAYYLQYQNRKTEFFEAIWKLWNWSDIEQRFAAATKHRAERRPEHASPALV